VGSHFRFGENWDRFTELIDEDRIAQAEVSLSRLLEGESLAGRSFLDIGSGSGIHSLAAINLGCEPVFAVDIDDASVKATRRTLSSFASHARWECRQGSVFDLESEIGTFDVVYSWGVLHHTGSLVEALSAAVRFLKPGGLAVFALYRKTPLCGFWALEKRWYSGTSSYLQAVARGIYISLFWLGLLVTGRSIRRYIQEYPVRNRGMDFYRDVHDWLGGYPYESVSHEWLKTFLESQGLSEERSFVRKPGLGLLGTGNDEYVFKKLT